MVATLEIEVLPGMRRTARKTPDGEWLIPDVPIFGTGRDERDADDIFEIDRAWLEAALERAELDARAGYLPPLHVGHTTKMNRLERRDPRAIGHFFARSIKPVEVDGETIEAIFADLIIPSETAVREFEAGAFPYRSAEIWDHTEPCIDSLALLASEPPFFRFGRLIVSRAPTEFHGRSKERSSARAAHFSFRGAKTMMDKPEDKTMADGEMPGGDAVAKMLEQVLAALAMIAEKLGIGAEPEDTGAAEMSATAEPPATVAAAAIQPGAPSEFAARLDGEREGMAKMFAAMSAKIEKLEKASSLDRRVAELASSGHAPDTIKSFRAKADTAGLVVAEAWLEGLSIHAPADPPSAREFFGASFDREHTGGAPIDPPEVEKYKALGPEKLAKARDCARSYARTGSDLTLERYLEINVDPGAFLDRARRR